MVTQTDNLQIIYEDMNVRKLEKASDITGLVSGDIIWGKELRLDDRVGKCGFNGPLVFLAEDLINGRYMFVGRQIDIMQGPIIRINSHIVIFSINLNKILIKDDAVSQPKNSRDFSRHIYHSNEEYNYYDNFLNKLGISIYGG